MAQDNEVFDSIIAAQKSTKDAKASLKPIAKKPVKTASGKDILFSTYTHYQVGKGKPMHITAASIGDLSKISKKDLIPRPGGGYYLKLVEVLGATNATGIAFGTLELHEDPKHPNHYFIEPNKYDFDIKDWETHTKRNGFTIADKTVHEIPSAIAAAKNAVKNNVIGTIVAGPVGGLVGTVKGVKDGFDKYGKDFMIVFDGTVVIKP